MRVKLLLSATNACCSVCCYGELSAQESIRNYKFVNLSCHLFVISSQFALYFIKRGRYGCVRFAALSIFCVLLFLSSQHILKVELDDEEIRKSK